MIRCLVFEVSKYDGESYIRAVSSLEELIPPFYENLPNALHIYIVEDDKPVRQIELVEDVQYWKERRGRTHTLKWVHEDGREEIIRQWDEMDHRIELPPGMMSQKRADGTEFLVKIPDYIAQGSAVATGWGNLW